MSECTRCGDGVTHGTPDRFRFRAWDYAGSSGTLMYGRLCVACWDDFLDFMATEGTAKGGVRA